MKKELEVLGFSAPLLATLGLGGLAIGGAAALGYLIFKELNKKGMALTDEDLKKIGELIDEKLDKKLDEKLEPIKNDIRRLNNRVKGLRDFWIANTVDKFIRDKYACKNYKYPVKVLANVQGKGIKVKGQELPSLELDRIFLFGCKEQKKEIIVILEFTETLTANMLSSNWEMTSEKNLYNKEKRAFAKIKNPQNTDKEFKDFVKLSNKVLYKFGRYINNVSIKDFYRAFAIEKLKESNPEISDKLELIFYYAAMRIENEDLVKALAKKLGVGIIKVSASLGECSEIVSPKVF